MCFWLLTVGTDYNRSSFLGNMIIANNAISNDLRVFWGIEEFLNETKYLLERGIGIN